MAGERSGLGKGERSRLAFSASPPISPLHSTSSHTTLQSSAAWMWGRVVRPLRYPLFLRFVRPCLAFCPAMSRSIASTASTASAELSSSVEEDTEAAELSLARREQQQASKAQLRRDVVSLVDDDDGPPLLLALLRLLRVLAGQSKAAAEGGDEGGVQRGSEGQHGGRRAAGRTAAGGGGGACEAAADVGVDRLLLHPSLHRPAPSLRHGAGVPPHSTAPHPPSLSLVH